MEGFPAEDLARQEQENQGRKYGVTQMFPARLVEDGAVLMLGSLQVKCISTPGHTPGHMVLYLPWEQLLFTGDHILFDITPNISIWHQVPHSLADYLSSLDRIRYLPICAAFPAHRSGEGNVYLRIDDLKAHHEQRLEEIRQAVEKHPGSTAYQIAGMIRWSARGLAWEQFPPHQKWFAMGETLAHLQFLETHKQVRRKKENSFFTYVSQYKRKAMTKLLPTPPKNYAQTKQNHQSEQNEKMPTACRISGRPWALDRVLYLARVQFTMLAVSFLIVATLSTQSVISRTIPEQRGRGTGG